MVGERIGNYKVVRKIGDGGMGAVFEAVHEQIGRRAAVKVLHPKYSTDQTIVGRFFNEARAVNIVQHPGIVGVFDFGTLPDGTAYIIMEYLEGEALNQRIKRFGKLGADSLRIVRQLAGTLAAAHSKGIIHRDLKPDNVIVVPDPEAPGGERAKVLDFGIAKIAKEANEGQDQGMTQTGMVMGTPKYMSPEQCRGTGQVDAKADVYSLGVMLFEMYCGTLPFVTDGVGALLAMHIYKPPPKLSEYDPNVMPSLEELVQQMLAKEPGQRPPMTEVAQRLEQLGIKSTQALRALDLGALSQSMPIPALTGQSSPGMLPGMVSHPNLVPVGQSSPGLIPNTSKSAPSLLGIAGQTENPTGVGARRQLLQRLMIPAGAALAVFAIAFAVIKGSQRGPQAVAVPAPTAAAAAPARVTLSLTSEPAGAQVVRASDGKVLGKTPLKLAEEAREGELELVLRRQGFAEKKLSVDLRKDASEAVTLSALAEEEPSANAAPADKPALGPKPGSKPVVAQKPAALPKPAAPDKPVVAQKPVPAKSGAARPARPVKTRVKEIKKDDDFIAPVR